MQTVNFRLLRNIEKRKDGNVHYGLEKEIEMKKDIRLKGFI